MLKWGSFIKEKDGEWDGLNNAAIYSFNSNIINSFVREMFQNSIDARDKSLPNDNKTGKIPPLYIRIIYKSIQQTEFPDFDGFYNIFKKVAGSPPNKDHVKFFNNAFKALGDKRKISLFIYEDFNTTGLTGKDDDPNKTFNACVVSEGISVKSESTAGGSFGIGKNAIYGLSKLRTVFFVSNDKEGEYIFQGKAKLASYCDASKTRDNKIYCGEGDKFHSVRRLNDLPSTYRKTFYRDQPGLSLYAICPIENKKWPEEFAKAILRNYWMLLEKGELIVDLFEKDDLKFNLSHANLEELLLTFYNPDTYEPENILPRGNPFEFYNCYKNGKCISPEVFQFLGKVRFYFKELDNKDTNVIAYLRNDMVVYSDSVHGYGSIGYCGLFLCDNDKGNEVLRAMEPPTHDSFDPERLGEKLEGYEIEDGYLIKERIKSLIKSGLQEILDKYTKPVEDISWLDDILSSITGVAGSGAGKRTNEKSEEETTDKIGVNINKTLFFKSQERNTVINNETGEIDGTGSGPRPGPGPEPGPRPGPEPVKKSLVKSRIFKTNITKQIGNKIFNSYKIYIESSQNISATDILLSQKGDSGNVAMFELGEAKVIGGENLIFTEETNKQSEIVAYRINSITIPSIIEVFINEPYKSSFSINKL